MSEANPKGKANPRYSNGNLRRKYRARFKAMEAPCGICHGKLGPIRYDEPSNSKHPLSFVIDEIKPVSRWREFGYPSPKACVQDWNNLQAAHYCCNQAKSNHVIGDNNNILNKNRDKTNRSIHTEKKVNVSDGAW